MMVLAAEVSLARELDPRQTVVHAVVVLEVIEAREKLVLLSDAGAERGRDAPFVDAAAGTVVVGLVCMPAMRKADDSPTRWLRSATTRR